MITEEIYNRYLANLLSGNKKECSKIVTDLLDRKVLIHNLYMHLFQKSMYEIGKLWENNRISVATEHMATSITEGLLNLVYPVIFSAEHLDKRIIISCVASEYHQLGGKMVADIFELNGWDAYFLGANTPSKELLKMIDEKKPDLLGLSMSLCSALLSLEETIKTVQSSISKLPIILGGQGFAGIGKELTDKYSNTIYFDSLDKLEKWLRDF
ncbi:MAG: cobalamin-dependent protein [Candidatus Riflebacteria bacterium]|nr:cobalamin-dependent protein [Candidatus Riflebacteria bacterium]